MKTLEKYSELRKAAITLLKKERKFKVVFQNHLTAPQPVINRNIEIRKECVSITIFKNIITIIAKFVDKFS